MAGKNQILELAHSNPVKSGFWAHTLLHRLEFEKY